MMFKIKLLNKIIFAILTITLLSSPALASDISFSTLEPEIGSFITIKTHSDLANGEVILNNQSFPIRADNNQGISIVPISYWWSPGEYTATFIDNQSRTWLKENIKIQTVDFDKSYLTIDDDQEEIVRPTDPERQARREKDQEMVQAARAKSNQDRLWNESFIWPLEGRLTTDYGATRYHNNELANRHNGIDIAAPTGTPVTASNAGQVTLAADLLVTGNTIIIDHGWNIYSSYLHLNELFVEKGDHVTKGEKIGAVGSTGFSTGPHLHWSISYNRIFLDPRSFVDLEL
ncbi:MAG: M23 family metallopeptidase [Halarsenatibacteraceae bacterium]